MAELFLDPKGFEKQISSFKSSAGKVKAIKYEADKSGLRLQGIDRYMECITEFNSTVALLASLLEKDVSSMEQIKGTWLKLDKEMAQKTLWEVITHK